MAGLIHSLFSIHHSISVRVGSREFSLFNWLPIELENNIPVLSGEMSLSLNYILKIDDNRCKKYTLK